MNKKRFTITQNGDNFSVMDNLKNRHMGMFEFKEDEFPVYFCFHKIIDLLNELNDKNEGLIEENEQLKIKLEDIALDMENAKGSNDDAQYELYKIKKENEKLKRGVIEVVDRYIRNVEHNPPSSVKTYLKVKGALNNVREGLRDLLEGLE